MFRFSLFVMLVLLSSCRQQVEKKPTETRPPEVAEKDTKGSVGQEVQKLKSFEGLADTTFVRLADFSDDFVYDIETKNISPTIVKAKGKKRRKTKKKL